MATLEGKTILIIGGSSGIGYAVAEASLKSRVSHIIISSSNQEKISNAVNLLTSGNFGEGKVEGKVVDATDPEALKAFVEQIGEVDHIIWTSGGGLPLGFPNLKLDYMKDAFDVRFWGPVVLAQNAKFKPKGSLTLTCGAAIGRPSKSWSILTSLMGAIDSLTRGLAVDLAPIRVNTVSPAFVQTELWSTYPIEEQKHMLAVAAEKLLVKHVPQPHEVAEAYLFAMKCDCITGHRIDVDGGYLLSS